MKKLSKEFVDSYKELTPPWGPIGYITYKRTYSRKIEEENRTEEWFETIERCINGLLSIEAKFSKADAELLYDHIFNLRCCLSGRALWQLGTETVEKIGGDSLQNCWAISVNDPVKAFCFTFNELMLGGGVGFNILPENVYELPIIKYKVEVERKDSNDVDFIVPDNREGWVMLLSKVLKSFYYSGKDLIYSTNCIRPRGRAIKSFGGVASESEDLVQGICKIVDILKSRYTKKLRPIDCLDIMNIIGSIVVAGNVRRSAQIALGSIDDTRFIDAKNWNIGTVPNHRCMSNNSVAVNDIKKCSENFWKLYEGEGEPYGLINLDTCQNYGRMVDGRNENVDSNIVGTNPCGEITLESYEACNLGEIFLPNIKDVTQFKEVARLLYESCKTISQLPFIYSETKKVVKKNQRIGIGITGYMQYSHRLHSSTFDEVYKYLKEYDIEYSKKLSVNSSLKLTTVKPSGTLSLLAGVTPGGHPAFSKYYMRRIRMAANDSLVSICRNHGYHVEPALKYDGTRDPKTMIVSFPIKTPKGTVIAEDVNAIDQLETLKYLQKWWSDNSVSITVYYHKKELPGIKKWLKENYDQIKSVSFLLHNEHGFEQAPYEKISKDKYHELSKLINPITKIEDVEETEFEDSLECGGGNCPIK